MLLTFRREQEHGIYISESITNKDEIMYPVYQQAVQSLSSIVRQAKTFEGDERKMDTIGVYGYCHNIIAFSGSRGQGKTSAMLSFSKALENSFPSKEALWLDSPLSKCRFTVLPPIDPTVLEQDQSILAVILSRMYRQAEKEWANACSRYSFSGDSSAGEAQRNALLRLFQQCLSGINNIKFRKGEEIRGLIEMHEISDSAVLKDNFNKLTTSLLKFIQQDSDGITPFLVVQLDDTDFQIRKSYEIMEDIRKYLTVPNIIILMATDLNMLRATLTQNLVRDFYLKMDRENLKGIIDINKLWKIESKHLDKLIPPTHAIPLPHLDNIIRLQSEDIRIEYWERDHEGGEKNILLPSDSKDENKKLSLQESVFQFVYRKTRIVFADSKTTPHRILPTTLRGLAQFLEVLSTMQSVPAIDDLDYHINPQELSKLVGKQVEILETNLSRFESYFLNDWVHAKLPVKKTSLFEMLMTTEMERQCWCAGKVLRELYPQKDSDNASEEDLSTYERLMAYVQRLETRFLEPDDVYVFFAIRMFFDFQAHRLIARQKQRAIEEQKKNHGLIIFDFAQDAENLSNTLSLNGTGWELLIKDLRKDQYNRIFREIPNQSFGRVLFKKTENGLYRFDPFYFIPFFLTLGKAEYKNCMHGEADQRLLYLVQTTCATIAINKDVQDVIRKALQKDPPPSADTYDYLVLLNNFFKKINDAVKGINDGADDNTQMIACWIEEIPKFMENENMSEFRNILTRLKRELTRDDLKSLKSIYNLAKQLSEVDSNIATGKDKIEAQGLWSSFVETSVYFSNPEIDGGLNLQILENLLNCLYDAPVSEANAFWKEFEKEFQALCKKLYYDFEFVKKSSQKDRETKKPGKSHKRPT